MSSPRDCGTGAVGTGVRVWWLFLPMALLSLGAVAYAARLRVKAIALRRELAACREEADALLAAARSLMAASRGSALQVLQALDAAVRAVEPQADAVAVFAIDGCDLQCIYTSGSRAQFYRALRLRRDAELPIAARAARSGARVAAACETDRLIPTDIAALAVPLTASGAVHAVVYVSSSSSRLANERIVRVVEQGAAPYALASEREIDRAQATFDGLTGLYGARAFRERLREDVAAAAADRASSFALWFIDTDHFKAVNDSLGHAAGDAVLQQMAAMLRSHTVPGIDLAARNGGDEFCAIVRDVQKMTAIERAQGFCDDVRSHDFGVNAAITASVGIAAFPYDAADAAGLLEAADGAMYHSKRSGRDCVSFCRSGGFAVYR